MTSHDQPRTGEPRTDGEPLMDHEAARRAAYAAVTAHLQQDSDRAATLVFELAREPVDAAAALLALVQACATLAEYWGNAIGKRAVRAWAKHAEAVALEASRHPGAGDHRRRTAP